MYRKFLLPALTATLICLGQASQLSAQDLRQQVDGLLGLAEQGKLADVWTISIRLSELDESEDALAQAIIQSCEGKGGQARLAAANALMDLAEGDEFSKGLLSVLTPAAKDPDPKIAVAAISLIGRERFFNNRSQPQLRELLVEKVGSDLAPPLHRIAAAKALWGMGSNDERFQAKELLQQFLRSSDRQLQVQGALALAQINVGSTNPAFKLLRQIAQEPTMEGQLAQSYLRIEDQRRTFDRKMQQQLNMQSSGDTDNKDGLNTIREIQRRIRSGHVRGDKVAEDHLLQHAAKGMLTSMDPHSAFFTSEEFQKFYFDLNPEYGGIGAFVNFDTDNMFSIVRPIYSGPAYKADLRSADKIVEVDGWETSGHTTDEIIRRMKGKPGSEVKLKIMRVGWLEPQEFTIVRQRIQVPSVNYEILPGDVAYIEIVTFGGSTVTELRKTLSQVIAKGAKGLVLDLRNNTGGYLTAAKKVVEQFIAGKQLVVYTKGRSSPRQDFLTSGKPLCPELPMAVLINGYSASASEITAGALQDHQRATIVGKRSYGKGSVQSLLPLRSNRPESFEDGNGDGMRNEWEDYEDRNGNGEYDIGPRMKLTIAHYYLPSGRCVHKQLDDDGIIIDPDWGVRPDSELELRENLAKDLWKNAELSEIVKKSSFREYVKKHIDANKELFVELAEGDKGDYSRYPEFDSFYEGLGTKLPKEDIRRWLRYALRDAVADLRGKAFPGSRAWGDFQEDAQLQEAVRATLEKNGQDIREFAAYKGVLRIRFDEAQPKKSAKSDDSVPQPR